MTTAILPILAYVLESAAKAVMIGVILMRRRGQPATRLTWIVLILAVPVAGILLYLLVGETRLGQRRRQRHREIVARISEALVGTDRPEPGGPPPIAPQFRQIATLAETVSGCFPRGGNRLRLIGQATQFIDRLVADIDEAREHCHLLFYIFLDDGSGQRIAEAIMRAAERGVACRLLVDAVGSKAFARSPLRRRLEAAGAQVVQALPARPIRMLFARLDLRNHRKIVVIDGCIGYMGSHNVADASFAPKPRYAPWVDVSARLVGPAVRDLQALFIEDWFLDTNESLAELLSVHPPHQPDGVPVQIVGTGPAFYNEALRQVIHTAVHAAREEIILTTPYFVPDEATHTALCTAARRGIATSLVVPARVDSRLVRAASHGLYEPLLEAGVRIYEFNEGMLHAKTLTLDRSLAILGSANLDRRSFELNLEVSMTVYDSDLASELRLLQKLYVNRSTGVSPSARRRRSWPVKLVQNAVGMLSPLL